MSMRGQPFCARSFGSLLLWLAALAVPIPGFAGPVTLFSDLGPGFPGDTPSGFGPIGSFAAITFTTTGAGFLTQISTAMTDVPDGSRTTGLYTNSGNAPGSLIENFTLPVTGNFMVLTVNSVLNPFLSANTQYWFVVSNPANISWYANDENVLGGLWSGSTLSTLTQSFATGAGPGIQLTGISAAPEPSSALLAAIGALAFAASKYRRSR